MKKIVNHIDHVAWISHPENLEANVARLEKLTGGKMVRFQREDMGFVMYLDWSAGLEIVSPMPERTDFNQSQYDHLEAHGEGVISVVFGIRGLEEHKQRLEALGFEVGPIMDDHPDSPWHDQLKLFERIGGSFLGSFFILGDIDYADGLIPFEDSPQSPGMKKFVNHIDHVAWISKPENLEANVAMLEKLSGGKMVHFQREDLGFQMYLDWSSGLELVSPLPERTAFNEAQHDLLDARGEGIIGIVYGVENLDKHKARLEALGFEVGPLMDDHADSPWNDQLNLWERVAGEFLGSSFILGDIDYLDGLISFEDA